MYNEEALINEELEQEITEDTQSKAAEGEGIGEVDLPDGMEGTDMQEDTDLTGKDTDKRQEDTSPSLSHLSQGFPKTAKSPKCSMTHRELLEARELFPELSDREIYQLYKRITSN